jgi:hypothetical protein
MLERAVEQWLDQERSAVRQLPNLASAYPLHCLLPIAWMRRAADLAACITVFAVRRAPVRPMEMVVTT